MKEAIHFEQYIPPLWDIVHSIRDKVEALLSDHPDEIRSACTMVASELIENAVKYGSPIKEGSGIRFEFTADERHIRITASNKIHSQKDYKQVTRFLNRIADSDNPEALYLERLHTLLDESIHGKSQLGLFRIAYEGKFTLSYAYTQDILTIIAVRNI